MRAYLKTNPSVYARLDSLNRLCRPVLFRAQSVLWLIRPPPETSSRFWLGSPHWTFFLWNRDSGAMYASMPMMGVTPAAIARLWKS